MHIGQIAKYMVELRLRNEEASGLYSHLLLSLPVILMDTHRSSQTFLSGWTHGDQCLVSMVQISLQMTQGAFELTICALGFGTGCAL